MHPIDSIARGKEQKTKKYRRKDGVIKESSLSSDIWHTIICLADSISEELCYSKLKHRAENPFQPLTDGFYGKVMVFMGQVRLFPATKVGTVLAFTISGKL